MNIGYACQNMELSGLGKGKRVTMNRSCIRRTFDEKGVDYISEITLRNGTKSMESNSSDYRAIYVLGLQSSIWKVCVILKRLNVY